jgi:hypothetical protein
MAGFQSGKNISFSLILLFGFHLFIGKTNRNHKSKHTEKKTNKEKTEMEKLPPEKCIKCL